MNEPDWALPFPGGVVDAAGEHALLRDRSGHAVALALADGRRLWRSDERLQPLLAGPDGAVGLALQPACVVALSWDGSERWRSPPLPWPAWTDGWADVPGSSDLQAGWLGGDVLLRWHLRPATGGAGRAAKGDVPVQGGCLLRAANGSAQALPAVRTTRSGRAAEPDPGHLPSSDPTVLAQRQHGALRFSLRQQTEGGLLRTTLCAEDAQGPRWQATVDEAPPTRARPPLPGSRR